MKAKSGTSKEVINNHKATIKEIKGRFATAKLQSPENKMTLGHHRLIGNTVEQERGIVLAWFSASQTISPIFLSSLKELCPDSKF